ncbi:putative GPI-anchored serine rich tenascin-like glycoprotein [Phytophthora palmivora]|uniref:GPI-anchored serine rich tenascin-like glycoprotein n=1 Tax=Phytophthora palmivora TaxID=4796 RepID=A0A2P4XAR9_9STRA|nr:putative GPI-anchored serine rich tenascin-like glycoprotein [Phytophthora palmivora]
MKCIRALAVFAAALAMGVAADDDPAYYCDSDSYCEKHYPGTACISVNNYGDVVSKCTPNTAKRPACRGTTPGLCPSYQSADIGYLNAHCVFVSEEYLSLSSSGSGSERRRLMAAASNSSSAAASAATSTASSGSTAASTASSSSTTSADSGSEDSTATESGSGASALYSVTIDGEKVSGQFVCLDVSDCASKAADPSTCEPTTCQAPDSKEVCTYHGTCTYKNKKKITKRTCMCYAGFEGDKCEKEVSNACDVDCGTGGDCVDGECVCKEGFDGKEYDGKQGKPNQRCTRCTNDLACHCQNGNTCNTETGKCICGPGYTGDTCGATEDSCTTRTDCGIGACQVLANGSSACYCPMCSPTCTLCDMDINSTFDCSTCPTDSATTMQSSKLLMFASMVVAVLLANLAL